MFSVTIASLLVLINGVPKGPITPSRGLRHGDPLSSYLFLLCTESLVSLLKNAALNCSLMGIKVCRNAPSLNHLLFFDDSLVLWKANRDSSSTLMAILDKYARASGQHINTSKTTMVFSGNIGVRKREEILTLWGSLQSHQYKKYLGLPPFIGKSRKKDFSEIKGNLWQKLHSWKGKLLSLGGKEV